MQSNFNESRSSLRMQILAAADLSYSDISQS
jgi:hypothetical protein